jgi:hypothetical protein
MKLEDMQSDFMETGNHDRSNRYFRAHRPLNINTAQPETKSANSVIEKRHCRIDNKSPKLTDIPGEMVNLRNNDHRPAF